MSVAKNSGKCIHRTPAQVVLFTEAEYKLELIKHALPVAMYFACLKGIKLDGLNPPEAAAAIAINTADAVLEELKNRKEKQNGG